MDMYSMESFPRLIEGCFEGEKVVYVAAGKGRSCAVTESGTVGRWEVRVVLCSFLFVFSILGLA